MIANRSIKQTETARDINPVIITVILSLLVIIPQYVLGIIIKLRQNIEPIDKFFTFIDKENLSFLLIIYATALTLILAYIFARKILKRNNLSLGLVDENKIINYGKGILLGFFLLTIVVLILKVAGFAEIRKNPAGFNIKIFLLFVPAWMLQGFEEEFLLRAILMNQMSAFGKIGLAIIANSLIFSILHLGNAGISVMSFVNIFLLGLVFSLIFYLKGSIYMAGATHSIWNMTMANIYGITVSGNKSVGVTYFTTNLKGPDLISGGGFGVEGSLVTTIVLGILLIILSRKAKKKSCGS